MTQVYMIADMQVHYHYDHRRGDVKSMRWVKVPTRHDTTGFCRVAGHARGAELYTAFQMMLQVSCRMPIRGVLANFEGPLEADDLAVMTRFPRTIFEVAFETLAGGKIGWLRRLDWEALRAFYAELGRRTGGHPEKAGTFPETLREIWDYTADFPEIDGLLGVTPLEKPAKTPPAEATTEDSGATTEETGATTGKHCVEEKRREEKRREYSLRATALRRMAGALGVNPSFANSKPARGAWKTLLARRGEPTEAELALLEAYYAGQRTPGMVRRQTLTNLLDHWEEDVRVWTAWRSEIPAQRTPARPAGMLHQII